MHKFKRAIRNFGGLSIKLMILPGLLSLIGSERTLSATGSLEWATICFLLGLGLAGILFSDMLILRYGDGTLHFSTIATRLVDVGFYARNRHPAFWFFSSYQLGVLLLFFGFTPNAILLWLGVTSGCILFLLFVQENLLIRSLGKRYINYKKNTPFLHWKLQIPEHQSVRLLPQLVWLFGMLVLRNWYKIKVSGKEHIPHDKPFILVANHESYLDPFLFGIFLPFEIQFVTTADVFTTPLMRFLLKGIGTFPMRRHRQDLKSIRTMIRMIKRGQVVGIFPEGGRSIDGSPLPILKETLKLIQHSKVPILPVHLDGAYEIWPRWAPNRRRGQVSATFKPIIAVEDQSDLDKLETQIQAAIFAQSKSFRRVKTSDVTKGLDNFLWACCKCHAHNSITVTSPREIKCSHCGSVWHVANDYSLSQVDSAQIHSLPSWLRTIRVKALEYSLDPPDCITLAPEEHAFLNSALEKFTSEAGAEIEADLTLTLTNQRFCLMQQDQELESWALNSITIFTMDYYNAISIGVGGLRYTFFLSRGEISLKWQTYFEALKAKIA
ncbi:MAG: 1-acyl-sn-glycerol-3-phosphate acyltransferase [Candidatus Marinimicrobia bacterium]|nr:1-acyl-sn-glycerol-3-phosphate acyltransferase [Candidatus Neomarinimicrobiota bacterium]